MTAKKKTAVIVLMLVTTVLISVSAVFLAKKTEFLQALSLRETRSMLPELTIVFALLFVSVWHPRKRWLSHLFRIAVILGYLWLHQALVPILAAGLYVVYLCLLGGAVTGRSFTGKRVGAAGFITGAAVQIAVVCLFSAAGVGGTKFFLIQTMVTFAVLIVLDLLFVPETGRTVFSAAGLKKIFSAVFPRYWEEEKKPKDKSRLVFCLLMAFLGTSFLLQAGRLGICLDYDSLHYGFRSAYVLDNGRGIFENLGSVNDVYVYPKGFEILTLPLAGLGSGVFVSAFSWWMTAATISAAAAVVNRMRGKRCRLPAGLFAAAVIAAVPGIMNMAVSAKTDAITLAVQMVCVLCFISEEKRDWWTALAAAILSLTLKPTAYLFSLLLVLSGIGLCIYRLSKEKKKPSENGNDGQENRKLFTLQGMIPAVLALAAFLAVTARTVHLAGVPLTTAGNGLWNALGFEMKYPFNGASITGGTEKSFLKRLIGVFACPAGEDMSHVYIAWGGLCVPLCLAAAVPGAVFDRKRERDARGFALLLMLLFVTAASMIMIRRLWQVDGNYFMLLYAMSVVCAFIFIGRPQRLTAILTPAMLFGFALCLVTNWAGAKGLTSPKLLHAGYTDTVKEQQLTMEAEGKGEIYDFLAEDPRNRVLALADQPACLAFPCNVQSYTDLEGSGGNVKLLKTLDEFKDFLDYAGTQYLYVEQPFIDARGRASDIVGYMLEDGSLVEEISADSAGAVLYRYTGAR